MPPNIKQEYLISSDYEAFAETVFQNSQFSSMTAVLSVLIYV